MDGIDMKLDINSPIPLYIQFKDLLLTKIESGEWQPQHKLPSERSLCNKYGISRITVREAIKELTRDGLIESVPGKGNFVQYKAIAEFKPSTPTLSPAVTPSSASSVAMAWDFCTNVP